jgi:multiple sugar transport system substrate-binding protein
MEDFNAKYPNIQLSVTGVASGEYNQKLLTRVSAGDAPEVFAIRPTQVPKLIDIGALEKLDRWINSAPWKGKLLPAQAPGVKDGSYYAVIFTSTPQALCYNKRIFADAGVEVPGTPEELVQAAQTIYDGLPGVFGYGCVTNTTNILHMNIESRKWVSGFGSDWAKDGKPTANASGTVKGIEFYKRLYQADFSPKGKDLPSLDQMIWEENLAMMIEGAWLFGAVKGKNPSAYPNIDAALPPTPTRATIVGGAFFGMGAGLKNADAAWKVLDLYNAEKWQKSYVSMTAQIPGQAGMITDEVLKASPWWAVFDEGAAKYAAAYGYMAPGFGLVADEYNNEIGLALAEILQGGADVKQRLDKLEQTLLDKFVK